MKNSSNQKIIAKIEMPIYYQMRKKKVLLGWNQIIPLHPYSRNNLKKWYNLKVLEQVSGRKDSLYDGKFGAEIRLYYHNARCDLGNVCSVADKFAMDALQEANVIINDNVNKYVESSYVVAGNDRDNPRVEIILYEVAE